MLIRQSIHKIDVSVKVGGAKKLLYVFGSDDEIITGYIFHSIVNFDGDLLETTFMASKQHFLLRFYEVVEEDYIDCPGIVVILNVDDVFTALARFKHLDPQVEIIRVKDRIFRVKLSFVSCSFELIDSFIY